MKNLFKLLLVIILISGCTPKNAQINDSSKYETEKNHKYIEEVEGFKTKKININNSSDLKFNQDYTFGFYETDENIFYQEFTNYINLFQNMFDEKVNFYHLKGKEQWKVEITYEDKTTSYVIFDFKKNSVTLSTFDALESMFKNDAEDKEIDTLSEKLYTGDEGYRKVEEPKKVVLDLNLYGFELKKVGEAYLVPSYLLQFVLSAYDNKLFYNGKSFDYFDLMDYEKNIETDKSILYTPELIDYATRFNLMIFDNFYGLKDFKGDYQEGLKATNTVENYSAKFSNFILSLKDKHTNIVAYAFGNYSGNETLEEKAEYKNEVAYNNRIGYTGDEKAIEKEKLSEDTLYVAVNSLEDADFAEKYLKTVNSSTTKGYKNIVIDLRCNGGGYVFNAVTLLYPFTNEDIKVNYSDITGGKTYSTYIKKNKKEKLVKSKVYILTSNLTFSAANEATMLFKDYNIGTIIGEKSGGGAATISSYNSPSGAYIIMSSGQMLSVNKKGEIIEDGIDVDYEFKVDKNTYKQELLRIIEKTE